MKEKQLLQFDNLFMLSLAIAIWIPCLLQWYFDTASLYHITTVFLFGTAYLLLTRMIMTSCVIVLTVRQRKQQE